MEFLTDAIKNPIGGANIFFEDGSYNLKDLVSSREEEFYVFNFTNTIGIKDVEDLQEYTNLKVENKKVKILIRTPNITVSSQNKLLKTLEEIQPNVYFFFFIPFGVSLIPTLLSRCNTLYLPVQKTKITKDFSDFLNASIKKRLDIIDRLWKNEDIRQKIVLDFLQELDLYIHINIKNLDNEKLRKARTISQVIKSALKSGVFSKTTFQTLSLL